MVLPALLRVGGAGVWVAGRGYGFLSKSPFLAGVLSTAAGSIFIKPVKQLLDYSAGWVAPIDIVDPYTLVRGLWIAPEGFDEWIKQLRYHGISEEVAKQLWRLSMRWPTVEEILQLYLLGVVTETQGYPWRDEDGQVHAIDIEGLLYGAQIPVEWHRLFLNATNRPLPLEASAHLFRRFGDYAEVAPGTPHSEWPIDPEGGMYASMLDRAARMEGLQNLPRKEVLDATRVYPPVGDLITMAVREVFTEEIATKFGQFENIPDKFITEARKSGLTPEYARWYWAAHWRLPGAEQGFRMFQRRIIDESELKMLLRALDVMPFWREKLISLAFHPLTRVDVRRMYKYGVIPRIDPKQLGADTPLVKTYTDLGYDLENSKRLAVWTDLYYPNPVVEAAIKEATSSFVEGFISETDFEDAIKKLVLGEDTEKFVLAGARSKRTQRQLKVTIKKWGPRLADGDITETDFREKVAGFGLSEDAITHLISDVTSEAEKTREGLTKAEVLRLYLSGLIVGRADAVAALKRAGLTARAADLLVSEVDRRRETGAGVVRLEDMKTWYKNDKIDDKRFSAYLVMEGYPKWALGILTEKEEPKPEVTPA
jgi:hypothetical protein